MFQGVKGTEDSFPAQKEVQDKIFDVLRKTALSFGFSEVDVPVIESMKLLTAKSGDELRESLFVFEKKGSEELGLRFDLTVPMTRMFVSKQRELSKPVKWFSINKNWRYESPQKGRQREFFQLSVELFGSDKPEADAEILNLMVACFKNLGLTEKDFVIKLSNRKILEGILTEIIPKEKFDTIVKIIDKSSRLSDAEFDKELSKVVERSKALKIKEIVKISGDALDTIKRIRPYVVNDLAKQGLAELEGMIPLIDQKFVTVDFSIARGIAYYTGNVFEAFDRSGKFRALAGGGRYDNLIYLLGGEKCPATGFAIGYATTSLLLEEQGKLPKPELAVEYFIAPVNEAVVVKAFEIAERLRKKSRVDIDIMERKLSRQLEYASIIGARKVVIVGEKDLKEGKVTVRDMKTGREEKTSVDRI